MITVVIPTLNESSHIGALLKQVVGEGGPELLEVIIADGGSTDDTCGIAEDYAERDGRVKLLHNTKRAQSAAMNLAVARADPRSNIIIRLDAHAAYPEGFVSRVAALLEETSADSIVVRLMSQGRGCFQKAVAAMSNSRLGSGGAVHRVGGDSRWIDHGHHAGFRRESFHRLSGYDQSFRANEDADYDFRLIRAGGRIWFTKDLEVSYFPRSTARALAQQYFRNGEGRAQNYLKNGGPLKLRQLAPAALLVGVVLSLALAPVTYGMTLGLPIAYLILTGTAVVILAVARREACVLGGTIALPIMHLAWASGFLAQLGRTSGFALRPGRAGRQER